MAHKLLILALAAACGKSAEHREAPAAAGSGSAVVAAAPEPPPPPMDAAAPPSKDPQVDAMLAAGTKCKRSLGSLSISCPEMDKVGSYANQNQGSESVAATCAAYLSDPDANKRFLAAQCLFSMNSVATTSALGPALDALEKETDADVRQQITWAIGHAEATTAKLDGRVLALVDKLAADPKSEKAAGYLFSSLFPQYVMGEGPKAPPAAQARAIEALTRDGTQMQHSAFNAVRLLDDKPAVCAALRKQIEHGKLKEGPDQEVFGALARMGEPCAADVPFAIEKLLPLLKSPDANLGNVRMLDHAFDLGAETRTKLVKTIKPTCPRQSDWNRSDCDKTVKQLSEPRVAKQPD